MYFVVFFRLSQARKADAESSKRKVTRPINDINRAPIAKDTEPDTVQANIAPKPNIDTLPLNNENSERKPYKEKNLPPAIRGENDERSLGEERADAQYETVATDIKVLHSLDNHKVS